MDHPPVHKYTSNQLLTEQDALIFYQGMNLVKSNLEQNIINNFEFVCCYILLYLRLTFQDKFIVQKLSKTIELENYWVEYLNTLPNEYSIESKKPSSQWNWIQELQPYFNFTQSELDKIYSFCEHNPSQDQVLPLVKLFQYSNLNETELSINQFLINWHFSNYPIQLYFDMPSVELVHKFQSEGTRCITAFVALDDINRVYTEDYPPFHTKNCLRFLYHDIQHLVKYIHSELFYEQRGFFKSVYGLLSDNNLLNYSKLDSLMTKDMDHLISDMNCSASQLIGFLKAKWISFYHRQIYPPPCSQLRLNSEEQAQFEVEIWSKVVQLFGIDDISLKLSLKDLCQRKLKLEEKRLINSHFNKLGKC